MKKIIKKPIKGICRSFKDSRGLSIDFQNIINDFKTYTGEDINHTFYSFSKFKGTARGLHYQKYPNQQTKMILILSGSIIDYCCNFFEQSNVVSGLQSNNMKTGDWIIIPENFLHGFITLSENTNILYLMSKRFKAEDYFIASLQKVFKNFDLPNIEVISKQDKEGKDLLVN